jgi:predicted MFS family arabinose efflux permease
MGEGSTGMVTDKSGRWLSAAVLAGLGVLAGQGFSRFTFGLMFPRMGAPLVGTTSSSSLMAAFYAAAYLTGIAALIYMTRHVAPLRLLVVGLATSTVGLLSIGVAHSKAVVIGGLIIAGLGAAITYVPALSFVGAAVAHVDRSKATGLAGAGIGSGIILARILTAVFGAESAGNGWRSVWISEAIVAGVVTAIVLVYAFRVPPVVEDRGVSIGTTFQMPHWISLGMAYFCFGTDYSIFSNLAVKGWELNGISSQWAANSLLFVAPAQIGGGFALLWLAKRAGERFAAQTSFVILALAMAGVALRSSSPAVSILSALFLGLVGAGITAQFVLIVRTRLTTLHQTRDATTTVLGVITLMYGVGGLVGLLGGAQLSKGHGSLTSTFMIATLVAFAGVLFARSGTKGLN